MKLIYVAGPYRAATEYGVLENIRRAEAAAVRVWRAGAAAVCPHKNSAFLGGAVADAAWLEGDREILRRCDAVVLVEGWQNSAGAVGEVEEARRHGIPVFAAAEPLEAWLARGGGPQPEALPQSS